MTENEIKLFGTVLEQAGVPYSLVVLADDDVIEMTNLPPLDRIKIHFGLSLMAEEGDEDEEDDGDFFPSIIR